MKINIDSRMLSPRITSRCFNCNRRLHTDSWLCKNGCGNSIRSIISKIIKRFSS